MPLTRHLKSGASSSPAIPDTTTTPPANDESQLPRSRELRKLLIDANPALGGNGSLKRKRGPIPRPQEDIQADNTLNATPSRGDASAAGRAVQQDETGKHTNCPTTTSFGALTGSVQIQDESRESPTASTPGDHTQHTTGAGKARHWFMPESSAERSISSSKALSPTTEGGMARIHSSAGLQTGQQNHERTLRPVQFSRQDSAHSGDGSHPIESAQEDRRVSREMRKLRIDANASLGGHSTPMQRTRKTRALKVRHSTVAQGAPKSSPAAISTGDVGLGELRGFPQQPTQDLADQILLSFAEAAGEWGLVRALQDTAQGALSRTFHHEIHFHQSLRMQREMGVMNAWQPLDTSSEADHHDSSREATISEDFSVADTAPSSIASPPEASVHISAIRRVGAAAESGTLADIGYVDGISVGEKDKKGNRQG